MGGIKYFWINFLYFIFNVCSAIEFIIFPSEKALTDKFHSLLGVLSLPFMNYPSLFLLHSFQKYAIPSRVRKKGY